MLNPKLRSLLKVAQLKSYTEAAKQLSLTQPAVSQHIHQLEEELDIRIFDRINNELIITPQGEIAVHYAERMQTLYENMKSAIKNERRGVSSLSVGITHTAESNPIAQVLARYTASHKGVNIKMITDTISNLYDKLRSFEIDLAIVEGRIPDPSLRYTLLDTDCLMLVTNPDHPLSKKGLVTVDEIKKENLILRLASSNTRNLFVSHLQSNNMDIAEFNVILEVDNIATIKDLVRLNYGVSVLPQSVCLDELKKGKIAAMPIENFSMMREMNIVYNSDFEKFDLLRDIISTYKETVKTYS
ncbi:MAG: LysR family transcriptional regulator [Ruminococcaceae bacterium]|nr:LysR family transcriptional regulator [Oscillospiraceae bacterium]